MAGGGILVLNAGSSSLKAAVFGPDGTEWLRAEATGIGAQAQGQLRVGDQRQALALADNDTALAAVLSALAGAGHPLDRMAGVGHRVVHGGDFDQIAARITPEIRALIETSIPLAPLHNPHHLAAIDAVAQRAPGLAQVACFDTAFHANQPQVARRYAIPDGPQTQGLRRYGFHGISYAALVQAWPRRTGTPLPQRVLAFHLGNGASICAIENGVSVATTMGYSPVSGLTMGTRAGDIDAAAVLTLARRLGIDGAEAMLTRQSGLLGLSGLSPDMRALAEATGNEDAAFAIDHFIYWAARHAGSLAAALGGVDALAFTGGIGENAHDIRARITDALAWLAPKKTMVIPAEEEGFIARQTAALVLYPTP